MSGTKCELVALSLAGCQLTDDDITPVTDAIKRGMSLHMLKLATNRITDAGIVKLVDSLLKHKTHCLALIDLMNNSVSRRCGYLVVCHTNVVKFCIFRFCLSFPYTAS